MPKDFIDQQRHDFVKTYLASGDNWVAETHDTVIAFMSLTGDEIAMIFVDPAFHGLNAGKALLDKAQEIHGDLQASIFKENTLALSFYAKYGFEVVEEVLHQETEKLVLKLKFHS